MAVNYNAQLAAALRAVFPRLDFKQQRDEWYASAAASGDKLRAAPSTACAGTRLAPQNDCDRTSKQRVMLAAFTPLATPKASIAVARRARRAISSRA